MDDATSPRTEVVDVPGARLHTEVRGAGPLLLLVVGGNGDPTIFEPLAALLAERWTVLTWVRRGFVRSPVAEGPAGQVAEDKVGADVDDAVALIERHGGPAAVLGSSSGAIVALELLVRRPDLVRTVVAHEPPLFPLLDDAARWRERFADVHALYRREGVVPAMAAFGEVVGMGRRPEPSPEAVPPAFAAMYERWPANTTFWFDHEYGPYPEHEIDLAALRRHADRLVLAVGHTSRAEDQMPSRPNAVLAERLGVAVTEMPGAHIGYLEDPPGFAAALEDALRPRS
ncbi:alpha/beta fold hydrolase [Actinomycetospora sp. CA-101289]|uniref:alpha/beta fold hydrolase n=1 Tax=Actinomycetospora sp. CA-101289 TaxID=3239893 RepID=UPI003D977756